MSVEQAVAQVCVAALQVSPLAHWADALHSTHLPAAVSQTGALPPHWASLEQGAPTTTLGLLSHLQAAPKSMRVPIAASAFVFIAGLLIRVLPAPSVTLGVFHSVAVVVTHGRERRHETTQQLG